jgi:hypothetical protein
MRRTLALLAVPVAVALHGCGDTCSTKAADVVDFSGATCTMPADQPLTFKVKGACQQCTDTSPSCDASLNGATVELNAIYHECSAQAGCAGTSCGYPTFSCGMATLPAGTYDVMAKTETGTAQGTVTVVPASGSSTCILL